MNIQSELAIVSKSKFNLDSLFSDLRRSYNQLANSDILDKQLMEIKSNAMRIYNDINIEVTKNTKALSHIKIEISDHKQTNSTTEQQIIYENLLEFFNSTKDKSKILYGNILDKISEIENIRLMSGGANKYSEYSEQDALINSHNNALASVEMARDVQRSLTNQMGNLEKIRKRVGDFVGELNIGKTLIRMISNRSAEDYRLILILTLILIVQIVVCYFYIRPWFKGS